MAIPPKNRYLGEFNYEGTDYSVFASPTTDSSQGTGQDEALVKRTEASFKKTLAKRGGQLPDGGVSIELTKQNPSDKPSYVFIRKAEILHPHLAAHVSAAAGDLNALEAMWSKDDPVTKELYYRHKFEALEKNSLHLFDGYLKTVPLQKIGTWEGKYNAIIQAAIPDFMSGNPPQLREVRDLELAAVSQQPWALENASEAVKNNKAIVMTAVRQQGQTLKYASDALKDDEDVVRAAVSQQPWALENASDRLKNNKAIVMTAVRQQGQTLRYASDALKDDEDVVLAAVSQQPWVLEKASDRLKNNKAIVMTAVRQQGQTLGCASDALKDDEDVVLAAVSQQPWALEKASDRLKDDKKVVMAAIQNDKNAFNAASPRLQDDPEVRSAAGLK